MIPCTHTDHVALPAYLIHLFDWANCLVRQMCIVLKSWPTKIWQSWFVSHEVILYEVLSYNINVNDIELIIRFRSSVHVISIWTDTQSWGFYLSEIYNRLTDITPRTSFKKQGLSFSFVSSHTRYLTRIALNLFLVLYFYTMAFDVGLYTTARFYYLFMFLVILSSNVMCRDTADMKEKKLWRKTHGWRVGQFICEEKVSLTRDEFFLLRSTQLEVSKTCILVFLHYRTRKVVTFEKRRTGTRWLPSIEIVANSGLRAVAGRAQSRCT